MSLAEKIALYTHGGKSPGVSEIIELREIARKEGVSNHNLEKKLQEAIEQSKASNAINKGNYHQFETKTNSSLFDKERLSFEEEIRKREAEDESNIQEEYSEAEKNIRSDFDPSFNIDEYKIDEQITSSDFEKIEIPENSIEIDYEKFQTETQEFIESKEKEEEIIIEDEIPPPPPVEKPEEPIQFGFTEPLKKTQQALKNEEKKKLKPTKSKYLLEKEAEWQSVHGKLNTYSPKKVKNNKTTTSSTSVNSTKNNVSEAQKVFNISIIAIFVSAFLGFIGIFAAFFAYARFTALKKDMGSNSDAESIKKMNQAKNMIIVSFIIGIFRFIFGFIVMKI